MPDDKAKRVPKDAQRVNVKESYELEYWSKKFGVTADRLMAAVKKAGVMAADVERELKKK